MIEVGRNSIVIRNVDLESQAFKNIRYKYSLYDPITHKYSFSVFTVIDKDLYFPASVSGTELQTFFPKKDIILNYKSTARSSPVAYKMKNMPRNDLQKEAIKFLMGISSDNNKRERFLSLSTGSGKTYVAINVISKLKRKPLIVVDTLDLAEQWKREFLNHTDLTVSDIVVLSGADSVEKELKEKNGKVYIAIHRTLGNMLSEDYNSVNLLMNKLKIGIRVFDEAHVEFKNVCMINSLSSVEYTIFLTATPGRSSFTDDHLYGKVFRRIPFFDGKELQRGNYHTVVLYGMDTKPPIDVKMSIKTKHGFSIPKWSSYVADEAYEILWDTIQDIFTRFKLTERNLKVAIILPTLKLIKLAEQNFKELNLDAKKFIGEMKKEERTEALNSNIILTNEKMFGKAIDVENLSVLINFVSFSSVIKTEQIMGRLRYKEGQPSILIDITDYGFDETVRQFKIRRRFYKKKAKKIINIKKEN